MSKYIKSLARSVCHLTTGNIKGGRYVCTKSLNLLIKLLSVNFWTASSEEMNWPVIWVTVLGISIFHSSLRNSIGFMFWDRCTQTYTYICMKWFKTQAYLKIGKLLLLSEHLAELCSAGRIQCREWSQTNAFLSFQHRKLPVSFVPGSVCCLQESPVDPGLWGSSQLDAVRCCICLEDPDDWPKLSLDIIGDKQSAEFQCPLTEDQETESHRCSISLVFPYDP